MFGNNKEIVKFVNKWVVDSKKDPEIEQKIVSLEKTYGVTFPSKYISLLKEANPIYCPDLLDYISDNDMGIYDVQDFIDPSKIREETDEYINGGMLNGYIGFALDCMGNMFCFKYDELKEKEEAKIYIFDHDFCEINEVADSFSKWIKKFNSIKKK